MRGQDTNPPPPKKNSGVRHFLCDTDCLTLECHKQVSKSDRELQKVEGGGGGKEYEDKTSTHQQPHPKKILV